MSLSKYIFPSSSVFSGFDDFFSTPFTRDFEAVPFLSNVVRDPNMVLCKSSPCYEVTENDKQFQLSVDVPGVKAEDVNIEMQDGGRVLSITGGRKVHKTEEDGTKTTSESRFEKRFVLDQSVDTAKITANLQDGVLTVTAPKNLEFQKTYKVPITQGASMQIENPQDSPTEKK
jgi:HSP20 family protein